MRASNLVQVETSLQRFHTPNESFLVDENEVIAKVIVEIGSSHQRRMRRATEKAHSTRKTDSFGIVGGQISTTLCANQTSSFAFAIVMFTNRIRKNGCFSPKYWHYKLFIS